MRASSFAVGGRHRQGGQSKHQALHRPFLRDVDVVLLNQHVPRKVLKTECFSYARGDMV